ncbi:MAG: DUF1552 domain-containing protein [Planctomycetaceae bacterium]|nr:DUF1552 domain-containing protein [Planctomycetaceae bacterium]
MSSLSHGSRPLHQRAATANRHHRRTLLRAAGLSIALPRLESLTAGTPVSPAAVSRSAARHSPAPRRLVCIGNEFGMYPQAFWPQDSGRDYKLSPLLEPLADMRDQFTVFRHLDHGLKGGHFAVHTFLTGVNAADARTMPDGGISLDQRAAEFVGAQTRFPSLTVGSDNGVHGGPQMSWTRTGTLVPPVPGPRELFTKLFVDDTAQAKQRARDRIAMESSILDAVLGDAKALQRRLNTNDGRKLDEYFSSVRDVEKKLSLDRQWQEVAKPTVDLPMPVNEGLVKDLPLVYDLIALALQTDSTRVVALEIGGSFAIRDLGIKKGYHSLSHHGKVPASIKLLVQAERYQMEQYARFLKKLKGIKEHDADGSLLDHTMVMCGSGMGNANSHTNNDLPIVLAGGGFDHGRHLVLPAEQRKRVPLSNLFVTMLQNFGLETDRFAGSNGSLNGLI